MIVRFALIVVWSLLIIISTGFVNWLAPSRALNEIVWLGPVFYDVILMPIIYAGLGIVVGWIIARLHGFSGRGIAFFAGLIAFSILALVVFRIDWSESIGFMENFVNQLFPRIKYITAFAVMIWSNAFFTSHKRGQVLH